MVSFPTSPPSAAQRALPPSAATTAVVLSGGGSRGAYEVGVLKALYQGVVGSTGYNPLRASVLSGTSVGAYNAAFLASHSPGGDGRRAIEQLEAVWRERIASRPPWYTNGIYRLRGSPLPTREVTRVEPLRWLERLLEDSLDVGSMLIRDVLAAIGHPNPVLGLLSQLRLPELFDTSPMDHLLAETLDLSGLAENGNTLFAVATDLQSGCPKAFHNPHFLGALGWRPIAASAAVPGILPEIWIDDRPYVDGGVTMNTPLIPALSQGALDIHVVRLSPPVRRDDFPTDPTTAELWARSLSLMMSTNSYRRAGEAWSALQRARELADDQLSRPEIIDRLYKTRPTPWSVPSQEPGQRRITVHLYTPRVPLETLDEFLDFRLSTIDDLIAEGYRDARTHDCSTAGCWSFPALLSPANDSVSSHHATRSRHEEWPRRRGAHR